MGCRNRSKSLRKFPSGSILAWISSTRRSTGSSSSAMSVSGPSSPLLLIRQPQHLRRPGVADEAGEDDDGEDVGDDLDELDGDLRDPLHLDRQRLGDAEE